MRKLLPLLAASLWACASAAPRFPQDIAESFARENMRRLTTPSLDIYYPEQGRAAALRVAARLERCVGLLRGYAQGRGDQDRVVVLITTSELNNAFVQPQAGGIPLEMVIPQHFGLELFDFFDLGDAAVGEVSCHEAVHYVQLGQTSGFWNAANTLFGDVLSPNIFTESWFLEGLATYYEGKLSGSGRPESPLFEAMLTSGVAAQGGEVHAGDLSPAVRVAIPFGGQYLVGRSFVDFLARKYGEPALWSLIEVQGESILSPLGLTLRFQKVYGKTIGELLDEWNQELRKTTPARRRPADQRIVQKDIGYFARLAAAPDGTMAIVRAGLQQETTLLVLERDGSRRFEKALADIIPIRDWINPGPLSVSGLSFSKDGKWLYLVSADVAASGTTDYRLRRIDAHDGSEDVHWTIVGMGGDLAPDGRSYVYVELDQDRVHLTRLDLESGRKTRIADFPPGVSVAAPAFSPDGMRIAFARRATGSFDLWMLENNGIQSQLTSGETFDYAPRWRSQDELVLTRENQVVRLDLASGAITPWTDVPYAAFDAAPVGDGLVLLNRDAWGWTLDAVAPPAPAVEPPAPEPFAEGTESAPADIAWPKLDPTPPPVLADRPYSSWDEIFVPRLRVPVLLAISNGGVTFGAALQGSDRLALHNWATFVAYDTALQRPFGQVAYTTYELAPVLIGVAAGLDVRRHAPTSATSPNWDTEDRLVELRASSTFWTSPVSLALQYLERTDNVSGPIRFQFEGSTRLVGPRLDAAYVATESTPYAGIRRGLILDVGAAGYPEELGSDLSLADVGAGITVFLPLPVFPRQSFALNTHIRHVTGNLELLELGGGSFLLVRETGTGQASILPDLPLAEPLRGYEDRIFRVDTAVVASATWSYPIIIDSGTTTFLLVLPSLFVPQIDIQAFADGAWTDGSGDQNHAAVGGLVRLRTLWGGYLPISVFYEVAHRFDPGLGQIHVVGLAGF